MSLDNASKKELRKLIEEELKNVEWGQRIHLDKKLLEELIFDTITECDFKIPIWTGYFLSKIDLSEISFKNVRFSRHNQVIFSNINATIDLDIINKPGIIYNVDFSDTKVVGKLKQSYGCNLANCGLTAHNLDMYEKGHTTNFAGNCLEGFTITSIMQIASENSIMHYNNFKDTGTAITNSVLKTLVELSLKYSYLEPLNYYILSYIEGFAYTKDYVDETLSSDQCSQQNVFDSIKNDIQTQVKQLKK